MNSASLAGRYDNPIPPRFLAPIDCLKIPALFVNGEKLEKVLKTAGKFNDGASIAANNRVRPELVFVDLLWSPRIDSQAGVPVRQPYLSYRPDKLHRLAKSIPRNRFLGSINVYKYGL
jgi:hypothetical protein